MAAVAALTLNYQLCFSLIHALLELASSPVFNSQIARLKIPNFLEE